MWHKTVQMLSYITSQTLQSGSIVIKQSQLASHVNFSLQRYFPRAVLTCAVEVACLCLCPREKLLAGVTLCMLGQEAADFLHSFETVMEQFARAMLHISRGYALPENDFQLLSVAHGPASDARDPWKADIAEGETVVARAPKWNSSIAAPTSWVSFVGVPAMWH